MTFESYRPVLVFWMLAVAVGCGSSARAQAEPAAAPGAQVSAPAQEGEVGGVAQGLKAPAPEAAPTREALAPDTPVPPLAAQEATPPPVADAAGAPSPPAEARPAPVAPPPPPPPARVQPADARVSAPKPPAPGSMLDIEARVLLEVASVRVALVELRQRVQKSGGYVVEEQLRQEGTQPHAELAIRVPSGSASELLDSLGSLGVVRDRHVAVKDVGKKYYDASLRLRNLEVLQRRYEQILALAHSVEELLKIEAALDRVRERIEVLKGQLRWLQDRSAQATLHVTLVGPGSADEPVVHPETKLYPSLRLTYLADFWRATGNAGYLGAGGSLRVSRHFSIDVDGLRQTDSDSRGLDYLLLTLGGELYSDYLGAGQRTWFNPYIGFRGGYARCLGRNELALGGSVGTEIYKSRALVVDLESRLYGVFGTDQGAHLAVQPAAGLSVAF